MDYFLHILFLISLYTTIALGLDLILGFTGLPSLGQVGFFAIGAYSSAILCSDFGLSPCWGALVGLLLCGSVAAIIAVVTLHMEKDYFALATLSFSIVVYATMKNLPELTGGPRGIAGIPPLRFYDFVFQPPSHFLIVSTMMMLILLAFLAYLTRAPYGKCLTAIRDDETAAKTLGIRVFRFRVQVFVIGALAASFAGSLYAHYLSYINPNNFTLTESIIVLLVVILGGSGSLLGCLLGATIIIGLPELLRFVGFPFQLAAYLRQIVFGLILILLVLFRPNGLVGRYKLR